MEDLYIEPKESCALRKRNLEKIEKEYSGKAKRQSKSVILEEIIKGRDYQKLFKHLDVKLHRKKYYSVQGNMKYKNLLKENCINISQGAKMAVYTCIVGKYDMISEPLFVSPNIDYYIFTDQEISNKSIWKKIDIKQLKEFATLSPIALNRKIKMLPHIFLQEYDYTMYIDGNIQIVTDLYPIFCNMGDSILGVHTHAGRDCAYMERYAVSILNKMSIEKMNKQLDRYSKSGFPKHYGLFQNSILVRKNCREGNELMEDWWKEYTIDNTRDQISLPYIMWKKNIDNNKIKVLGADASRNPRFCVGCHL